MITSFAVTHPTMTSKQDNVVYEFKCRSSLSMCAVAVASRQCVLKSYRCSSLQILLQLCLRELHKLGPIQQLVHAGVCVCVCVHAGEVRHSRVRTWSLVLRLLTPQ